MRLLFALALPVITSQPATAQTAAAPSAAAVAAATAMVEAISPKAKEQAGLDAQLTNIRRGALVLRMIGNSPRVQAAAKDKKAELEAMLGRAGAIQAETLSPIFRQRTNAVRDATIRSYASQFTIAELNSITAFYKSAPGAKLLAAQPTIAAQVNQQVNAQYAPNVEAAQKGIAPRVEAEVKKMFPDQPAAAPQP
jgi:hypothetical protein